MTSPSNDDALRDWKKSTRRPGTAELELVSTHTGGKRDREESSRPGSGNRMDDRTNEPVNDKSALLNQLRIDRTEEPEDSGGRRGLIWAGIATVVALIGGYFVYRAMNPDGIPIKVATARQVGGGSAGRGASTLDASGYIVARRQATVSSKITGKVMEVLIEEGQRVSKDQVIARLDDSNYRTAYDQAKAQLAQAQANVHAAQVAFDNAKPIFERNKKQIEQGVISGQTFDTAKAAYDAAETSLNVARSSEEVARAVLGSAQQNLADTVIRAPYAGIVTVRAAQAGEIVSPMSAGGGFTRTGIGTIVDMESLELEVDVSENFINRVKPQQPASVKLNAYPDWEIPAEVIAVIPTADRAKATVKVRIGFKLKDARILPEMGARVSFLDDSKPTDAAANAAPAVVIPAEAVQAEGDTGVVYIVSGETVERRTVRLGAKTNDGQVVLSGLTAGTTVAIADLTKLSDKAEVRIEP
jgi:RND family efflux transporter MFP subunit